MSANIFGNRLKMLSFGESHGPVVGVVIDGFPSGIKIDYELLNFNLMRRRPGGHATISQRQELDEVEILSGVYENISLGTPIAMMVRNKDMRSNDYENIKQNFRIGHADKTWSDKFSHWDHRGGGRASGRETLARVMAGSLAQMLVLQLNPKCRAFAFSEQVGNFKLSSMELKQVNDTDIDQYPLRFPGAQAKQLEDHIISLKEKGESIGGILQCKITEVPSGLGQPVFHKLKSELANAVMSIGAIHSFELGKGWQYDNEMLGTEFHGMLVSERDQKVMASKLSDVYGGIKGGISTGDEIVFRCFIKPTSSILDIAKKGRHDPYIGMRAIPVIEAMVYFVLADHLLWCRTDRI